MASPELEATPSSIVVNVHHGRAKHAIEIPISATIAELKAKLHVPRTKRSRLGYCRNPFFYRAMPHIDTVVSDTLA